MNFIVRNEGFQCGNCKATVRPLDGSCRNHCSNCLFSLHVDEKFPGDRQSTCQSLMAPIGLQHSGKKGWLILHECLRCKTVKKNQSAKDDNMDLLIELSRHPRLNL